MDFLEDSSRAKVGAAKDANTADSKQETGESHQRLLCARCEFVITTSDARMAINDQHEHSCVNPHGFVFRIGCFARAPGCVGIGRAESYWSWFPGYSWQLVLCRACHAHLGWHFRAGGTGGTGFHGLILDRLRPES